MNYYVYYENYGNYEHKLINGETLKKAYIRPSYFQSHALCQIRIREVFFKRDRLYITYNFSQTFYWLKTV